MLKIENLSKVYNKKFTALENINLTFSDKGLVFIVGKSGSGKSTLLNMISGVDEITSGDIIVDGNSVNQLRKNNHSNYLGKYIGFIFQDYFLIDNLTVYENIELSLNINHIEGDISEVLASVGLAGYENKYPYELSGGEAQRVAIARTVIKKPHIILADEPTGNLDQQSTDMVLDILKKISKDCLIIMVSHDMDDVDLYADRVITLHEGKVLSDKIKDNSYINDFSINDTILSLPHHKNLTEENINEIKNNNITKVIQLGGGFIDTNSTVEEKKGSIPNVKPLSIKKKIKLFFSMCNKKPIGHLIKAVLSCILLTVIFVFLSLSKFNFTYSSLKSLKEINPTSIVFQKGSYSANYKTSEINKDRKISDDEYNTITSDYNAKTYKLYNQRFTKDVSFPKNQSRLALQYERFYSTSTLGILECDEEYIKNKYGSFEVIIGDPYINTYGVTITDYLADSIIKNNNNYNTYEELLGEYYPPECDYYQGYINAIIKTDYKEKYNNLINQQKINEESIEGISLSSLDNYKEFFYEANHYLNICYTFVNNYKDVCVTTNNTTFTYLINSNASALNEISLDEYRLLCDNSYNLSSNEIMVGYQIYNLLFNTSYLPNHIFSNPSEIILNINNEDIKLNVVGLIKDNELVTSKEVFLKTLDKTVFSCSIYFSDINQIDNILGILNDNYYLPIVNDLISSKVIYRVVTMFLDFVFIINTLMFTILIFFLSNIGYNNIKRNVKKIGILKAMGMKQRDINFIFILKTLSLGGLIILLSFLAFNIGTLIANSLFVTSLENVLGVVLYDTKIFLVYTDLVFITILIAIVSIMISSIIPLLFINKLEPIKLLKAKE